MFGCLFDFCLNLFSIVVSRKPGFEKKSLLPSHEVFGRRRKFDSSVLPMLYES